MTGPDRESLVDPFLEHLREAHQLDLTPTHVLNYVDAEERNAGAPTERLETIGEVEIVPIRPQRSEAVAKFFDYGAFRDNPAWASCYCTAYFEDGEAGQPWQQNRAATCHRIEEGVLTGSLAYVDGKLAGFCNASNRDHIERYATGDDEGVCSVVCFVVAPPYRRHGLAGRLLNEAVEEARRNGFHTVEAYPRRVEDNAAHAYAGTPELYEAAGFKPVSEDPLVYRLEL